MDFGLGILPDFLMQGITFSAEKSLLKGITGSSFVADEAMRLPNLIATGIHDGAVPSLLAEAVGSDFISPEAGHVLQGATGREGIGTMVKNLFFSVPGYLMNRSGLSESEDPLLKSIANYGLSASLEMLSPLQKKIDDAAAPMQQLLGKPLTAAEKLFDKGVAKLAVKNSAARTT